MGDAGDAAGAADFLAPEALAGFMQHFLTFRDSSGAPVAAAASALARAALPLATDWVRGFMLTVDIASDVRVLASDTPRILMSAGVHSHGGSLPNCDDLNTYMLAPVTTIGDETVGLCVASTGSGLDAVSVIGRYHFCHSTGAFLLVARDLPHETDPHVASLSFLRTIAGVAPVDASEAIARRRKTHVVAWPAVRGRVGPQLPLGAAVAEKLCAIVDSELFEAGNYWQCIYSAIHQTAASRKSCADCLARDLDTALSMSAPQAAHAEATDCVTSPNSDDTPTHSPPPPKAPTPCTCRDVLLPPDSAGTSDLCERNMRLSLGGSWIGASACISSLPGLPAPPELESAPFVLNRVISMSLQFVRDATACAPLESLALTRAMAVACVPGAVLPQTSGNAPTPSATALVPAQQHSRGTMLPASPHTAPAVVEQVPDCSVLPLEANTGGGDEDMLALSSVSPAVFEAALSDAPSDKKARSLALAEARRRRNREAAARSNARRKERNDSLRTALREARAQALALRAKEMELRSANVALRTRVETAKAEGRRGAAS